MTVRSPLIVAQITDMHLFADTQQELLGMPTRESFQAVLHQVSALEQKPDILLLTGDLSQDGQAASYRLLQDMVIPLGIPTYWLPGNHDCVPVMEKVLQGSAIVRPQKSFQAGGWNFVLLNSQIPGRVHGYLDSTELSHLETELQRIHAADTPSPTLIACHHPPLAVDSTWLDSSILQNPEALFAVLDRYPHVKLVVFGHIHQDYSRIRRQVQYLGTPSTSIQFEPHSPTFSLDQARPGFRLLHLYPDGTWWTAVERSRYTHQLDLAAAGY
jgi:3',5'-cyclic-AMP phosphodiesterase